MTDQRMPAVVIPSLEPDERLPAYVEALMDSGFKQIIVVDDGSGEGYRKIFQHLSELGATVLTHEVNKGKGAALKNACRYLMETGTPACGVLTADSDGQHTVPDCLKLAEALRGNEDALYLGSRDFSLPNVPYKSRNGNRITSAVFKALYGVYLPDTQTGLRAFAWKELPYMAEVEGDRYEYEMNVLIDCARRKVPMVPITIETVYENNNEGTHFHPFRDSWRIYKVIFAGFFRFMGASLICFVLDQGLAAILREWLLPLMGLGIRSAANVFVSGWCARLVSAVVNYQLNKNLVFRIKGQAKGAGLRYAALCVAIICLSNAGVWLLQKAGIPGWLAKLICDGLLYFVSYRVQERWVFAKKKTD